MDRNQLKHDLKVLIIAECQKGYRPEDIADDAQLIGGKLDLDSLDALQISVAVQQRYGKRIGWSDDTRNALASINALADFILA
jgi:acyl carrier protein